MRANITQARQLLETHVFHYTSPVRTESPWVESWRGNGAYKIAENARVYAIDRKTNIMHLGYVTHNPKTGYGYATAHMVADKHPVEAIRSGEDGSTVCKGAGGEPCPYSGGKGCYVNPRSLNSLWKGVTTGKYLEIPIELYAAAVCYHAVVHGDFLRLGSYGNPSTLPQRVQADVMKYVSQLNLTCASYSATIDSAVSLAFHMASVQHEEDALRVAQAGGRVFWSVRRGSEEKAILALESIGHKAIICPETKTEGKIQCRNCGLCSPTRKPTGPHIIMPIHGAHMPKAYDALRKRSEALAKNRPLLQWRDRTLRSMNEKQLRDFMATQEEVASNPNERKKERETALNYARQLRSQLHHYEASKRDLAARVSVYLESGAAAIRLEQLESMTEDEQEKVWIDYAVMRDLPHDSTWHAENYEEALALGEAELHAKYSKEAERLRAEKDRLDAILDSLDTGTGDIRHEWVRVACDLERAEYLATASLLDLQARAFDERNKTRTYEDETAAAAFRYFETVDGVRKILNAEIAKIVDIDLLLARAERITKEGNWKAIEDATKDRKHVDTARVFSIAEDGAITYEHGGLWRGNDSNCRSQHSGLIDAQNKEVRRADQDTTYRRGTIEQDPTLDLHACDIDCECNVETVDRDQLALYDIVRSAEYKAFVDALRESVRTTTGDKP